MRSRRGHLLVEALCALALAGLLAVACAAALLHARRLLAGAERRARAERAGLEALQVVAAIARDADSIVVLADTAVELHTRIADGVGCAREGEALVLPPARTADGASLVAVALPIEAGDELRGWVEDTVTGYRAWTAAVVESVTTRTGETPCGSAGGLVAVVDAGETRLRLVATGLDARVGAGSAVRIGRRGRIALYNGGGGQWMLGWRRCANGTCGLVQPVAGPLRSPATGGFRVRQLGVGVLEVEVGVPGVPGSMATVVVRTDAGR